MIVFDTTPYRDPVAWIAQDERLPSAQVDMKWHEMQLDMRSTPARRYSAPARSVTDLTDLAVEVELDSPDFRPAQLDSFAARGFVRKNRWAASKAKGTGDGPES